MRLESVHLHAIGPFADYTLDLATLGDARLIAVIGPNGAG
jgi:DNA repair exonuclease SbcCD ATPase subunit